MCAALGLRPVPATQVIARDRHAEYLWACASVGATVELFATEIRHLQRTEVGEVEEPFRAGQKGSSAMPHKRNPIMAERLAGLARVLRGNLGAGLEDVALWHERDISHSSVERIILPDASLLAYYLLVKMRGIIDGMQVHPDRMLENLDRSYGLVFSQPVLLALVAAGLGRDEAYRIVQEAARTAWEQRRPLRAVLDDDQGVRLSADCSRRGLQPRAFAAQRRPRLRCPRGGRRVTTKALYSGKVRDVYDAGDGRLLFVASDRMSAFDVVMAEPIPDKGGCSPP